MKLIKKVMGTFAVLTLVCALSACSGSTSGVGTFTGDPAFHEVTWGMTSDEVIAAAGEPESAMLQNAFLTYTDVDTFGYTADVTCLIKGPNADPSGLISVQHTFTQTPDLEKVKAAMTEAYGKPTASADSEDTLFAWYSEDTLIGLNETSVSYVIYTNAMKEQQGKSTS